MNIITCIKSIVAAAILASTSSAVFAGGNDNFPSRIAKQINAIEVARKAKEINLGESQSLKKEIDAIQTLYKLYWGIRLSQQQKLKC